MLIRSLLNRIIGGKSTTSKDKNEDHEEYQIQIYKNHSIHHNSKHIGKGIKESLKSLHLVEIF